MTPSSFRFDKAAHEYFLDGELVPHITGMLEQTGWIDSTWMSEESSVRGTAIHALTAAYDFGALDITDEDAGGIYRGWLLGYAAAMKMLGQPTWDEIEQPGAHPTFRFGGRPDRVGKVFGVKTVMEIKSGAAMKSHPIQTALQAILRSASNGLPAELWGRRALYLKANGTFRIPPHCDKSDFVEAYKVIKRCCST